MLLYRFKILGHSMIPTFDENDSVIASAIPYWFRNPQQNDVVIFERNKTKYIKRIKYIEDNKYFLSGDNEKDSLDSNKFGFINRKQIKGKIILKI